MTTGAAISIIMPCHNSAEHVAASVASALGQTFGDTELIAVDDGSGDATLDILNAIDDPRLRIIAQENRGVSAARNRGLDAAQGDYVAFLDADDSWDPSCLEKLHALLSRHPEAVLAYCGWRNIGLSGGRGEPYIPPDYEGPGKLEALFASCPWPIHATLTRRAAITAAGGFDTRFVTSEDYLLWLGIALDRPIVRVPEVLAFYHFHAGQQATGDAMRLALDHWQVQREFLAAHPGVAGRLGPRKVRELTHGELLDKGLACYWDRNLEAARPIFRRVMRTGYGKPQDWKLMLPALLPLSLHRALVQLADRDSQA